MVEGGQESGLSQELAEVQVLLVRDLDRDVLVDPRIASEVDGAEPATPEGRDDLVLPELLTSK